MHIIIQEPEKCFIRELSETALEQKEALGCLVFKLSHVAQKPEHWFWNIVRETKAILNDKDGTLFRFDDTDVILLAHGLTKNSIAALMKVLPFATAVLFYELPAERKDVAALCQEKLALKSQREDTRMQLRKEIFRTPVDQRIADAVQNGATGFDGRPFTAEQLLHYIWNTAYVQEQEENTCYIGRCCTTCNSTS